jgi:hypothetical protein
MPSERSERWAPALQRTVEPDDASLCRGMLRCVRGTDAQSSDQSRSDLQTADASSHPPAHFARALPDRIALVVTRAQGRPGAGWHPGPCAGRCTRGGPQVSQSPGLPCAMVYGLLRALLGERCTIAPVAERIADVHARSGSNITAGLDAQTPGVRTTRLDRPRTSSLGLRELACAHARSHAKTLSASCRTRGGDCSRQGRPAIPIAPDAVASIATLPAVRDDRDPSLVSDRVVRVYGKSEFR